LSLFVLLATTGFPIAAQIPAIRVEAPAKLSTLRRFTQSAIESQLRELRPYFGPPTAVIRVIIVDSEKSFKENAGPGLPYWTSAVTIFPPGKVIIKSPNLTHSSLRQYKSTINHELVHLLQGQLVPLSLTPTWFDEGVALYLSNEFDLSKRVALSRAVVKKRTIPLDKLSGMLRFAHVNAELAYSEAASAIEFLTEIYGPGTIRNILQNMRNGKNFTQSLSAATNLDYVDFTDSWQDYIQKTYRWIFLLEFQHILWFLMLLLLILAYLSVRKRNSQQMKTWDKTELLEDEIIP